jgi:hypothetical protein
LQLKVCDQELVEKVHKLLKESDRIAQGSVMWFSLHHPTLKMLRKHDPSIPTVVSVPEMIIIMLSYFIGLLPFLPLQCDFFAVPCDRVDYRRIRNELFWAPDFLCSLLAMVSKESRT